MGALRHLLSTLRHTSIMVPHHQVFWILSSQYKSAHPWPKSTCRPSVRLIGNIILSGARLVFEDIEKQRRICERESQLSFVFKSWQTTERRLVVRLSTKLSFRVDLSIYLSIYLSSIYISIYLSIYLPLHQITSDFHYIFKSQLPIAFLLIEHAKLGLFLYK